MPSSATANERDPAIDFLLRRIDYERVTTSPYGQREFKLERMRALLEAADNPHARYPIVHVAGTKGKGSTAAMLASILTATGRRTGLFSSPHLWRVEERIAIDRRPCDSQEFAKLLRRLQPVVAALDQQAAAESPPESGPTYFEILTAAALLHFAEQKVDMAVLEVGLGGRLDSTNVCSPEVAIITNISFDHMKQLGHTLSLIAAEKAGIIKSGIPVVSGVVDPEPREVIRRIAAERGAPLCELSRDFNFDYLPPPVTGAVDRASECRRAHFNFFSTSPRQRENDATDHDDAARLDERRQLPLPLLGRHQAANAAIAIAAVDQLRRRGWPITDAAIRAGLLAVEWPARLEVIHRSPTILLDAAHNVASIEALLAAIDESFSARPRKLVFATTKDKEIAAMLRMLLPRFDQVIFTRYHNNPRGVAVEELLELATEMGATRCAAAATPEEAWALARHQLAAHELVVITGSFFIAAEMRTAIDAAPLGVECQ